MNIRMIPPLLLVIGSFAFLFFAVKQTSNRTSLALKVSASRRIEIEGSIKKYALCPSRFVCHFIVDNDTRYDLDSRKYPSISESFADLNLLTDSKVRISGLWIEGKNSYMVIISITSL